MREIRFPKVALPLTAGVVLDKLYTWHMENIQRMLVVAVILCINVFNLLTTL